MEENPTQAEAVEEKDENGDDDETLSRTEEKDLIIDLVRRLMLRGVSSTKAIQSHLKEKGFSRTKRSIYRYKSIVKKRMEKAIREKDGLAESVEQLAYKLKETYEEISREAWREYHRKEQSGHVRIQALKTIQSTAKEYVELMQSMGMTYKAPDKVMSVNQNIDLPYNTEELEAEFVSFIKAKYQDPAGEAPKVDQPKPPTSPQPQTKETRETSTPSPQKQPPAPATDQKYKYGELY